VSWRGVDSLNQRWRRRCGEVRYPLIVVWHWRPRCSSHRCAIGCQRGGMRVYEFGRTCGHVRLHQGIRTVHRAGYGGLAYLLCGASHQSARDTLGALRRDNHVPGSIGRLRWL
jgi:hypothetical protein